MARSAQRGTRGKRRPAMTGTSAVIWLREQLAKEHPGFNPVIEMVRLYHKAKLTKRDRERFDQLVEIAKYIQPKLKNVEISPGPGAGDGMLTIKWKGE